MKLKLKSESQITDSLGGENSQRVSTETSLGMGMSRERQTELLKEKKERARRHMMEIIPSTFLQYIPLSPELIFIFISTAEVTLLLTFT